MSSFLCFRKQLQDEAREMMGAVQLSKRSNNQTRRPYIYTSRSLLLATVAAGGRQLKPKAGSNSKMPYSLLR